MECEKEYQDMKSAYLHEFGINHYHSDPEYSEWHKKMQERYFMQMKLYELAATGEFAEKSGSYDFEGVLYDCYSYYDPYLAKWRGERSLPKKEQLEKLVGQTITNLNTDGKCKTHETLLDDHEERYGILCALQRNAEISAEDYEKYVTISSDLYDYYKSFNNGDQIALEKVSNQEMQALADAAWQKGTTYDLYKQQLDEQKRQKFFKTQVATTEAAAEDTLIK